MTQRLEDISGISGRSIHNLGYGGLLMKFSNETKLKLFILLIVLNLILRYHPACHEIGSDSFEIHILANSLSEFGEARWWVHPLSVIGMYPNSYTSGMPFILSGVSQCSGVDIELVTFIYSVIFGIFSIFASYMLAGVLYDDDFFKFIVALGFSTSVGILAYSTWTANARSLFILIFPLFLYTLLQSRKCHLRFGLIGTIAALLLLTAHHLVFYLIPLFAAYFGVLLVYKFKKHIGFIKISEAVIPFFIICGFGLMLAYPFMTHKFMVTGSRWECLAIMLREYPRYIGMPIFLSIGGFIYLIFKPNKRFVEWFLLIALMVFSVFVFDTMYMKWFIIIFAILLAGVSFMNLRRVDRGKCATVAIAIFLLSSVCFSGYIQFLHEYGIKRYISDDTYFSSLWIKENICGRCICNDVVFRGSRLAAISGVPFLTVSAADDQAYGFVDVNSEYELVKNPIMSEEFWKNSPYVKIKGTSSDGHWHSIMNREYGSQVGSKLVHRFNISYLVEATERYGNWYSRHGFKSSKFVLSISNEKDRIYDNGNVNIWKIF
jgi:hypothetical protein